MDGWRKDRKAAVGARRSSFSKPCAGCRRGGDNCRMFARRRIEVWNGPCVPALGRSTRPSACIIERGYGADVRVFSS
jgi:hypothetical protein